MLNYDAMLTPCPRGFVLPPGVSYNCLRKYRALRARGMPAKRALEWAKLASAGVVTAIWAEQLHKPLHMTQHRAHVLEQAVQNFQARWKLELCGTSANYLPQRARRIYARVLWHACYGLEREAG